MFKKILAAYDGCDGAKPALAKAGKIAGIGKAEIHVLKVAKIPEHAETVDKAQKAKDLIRCTNCWEGFDWEENPPGDRSGECPRCGSRGQVIQGGFLAAEERGNSEDRIQQ